MSELEKQPAATDMVTVSREQLMALIQQNQELKEDLQHINMRVKSSLLMAADMIGALDTSDEDNIKLKVPDISPMGMMSLMSKINTEKNAKIGEDMLEALDVLNKYSEQKILLPEPLPKEDVPPVGQGLFKLFKA